MAVDWNKVVQDVDSAFAEAGFVVVLEKRGAPPGGDPWNPQPGLATNHEVRAVQDFTEVRDFAGTLTRHTRHTLTLAAVSTSGSKVVPEKKDRVRVSSDWFEVEDVRPVSPGNVDLMYEVDLNG